MKTVAILVAALHALPGWAQLSAANFVRLDEGNQLAFIAGYMEGVRNGSSGAILYACADEPNPIDCSGQKTQILQGKYLGYLSGLSPGQVHKGVVAFYADYRNARVSPTAAIHHVSRAISGVPAAELEEGLELLRRLHSQ